MAARYDVAPMHVQQLVEQQVQEELRKSAKRAANRRSASTCRARKKILVETMAEANERMRKRSRVLSLLPDMILAMRRDGVVTYASENCRQFLKYTREEVEGANIFDLVKVGSHDRLRRLMEDNLGAGSKEAIALAVRFQGTSFGELLTRSEQVKEEGEANTPTMNGDPLRLPQSASRRPRNGSIGGGSGGVCFGTTDMEASTDETESETATSTRGSLKHVSSSASINSSAGGGKTSGDSSGNNAEGGNTLLRKRKSLPPLGPAVFASDQREVLEVAKEVKTEATPAPTAARQDTGASAGGVRGTRSLATCTSSMASGLGVRTYDLATEISGGIGGGTVASVDRELQSKINAFTNTRKDMCKLEMLRQDENSEWYEVRSSMRLVWLKAKQEIVPVEVICSFQRMHVDSPAGSSGSIVARLQRAAAMVGSPPAADSNDDSSQSVGGFSVSGTSAGGDSGTSPTSSSADGDGDGASSSDYGGGASSGSGSGSGSRSGSRSRSGSVDNESNSVSSRSPRRKSSSFGPPIAPVHTKLQDRCGAQKGKCTTTAMGSVFRSGSGFASGSRQAVGTDTGKLMSTSAGRGVRAGEATASGPVETKKWVSEQMSARDHSLGKASGEGERLTPSLAPTARRLAMSAKKSILFRHGFDNQPEPRKDCKSKPACA